MSNDVKVEFDGDPNGNHQKMLESFVEYVNLYEKYLRHPSQMSKRKCRTKLKEIYFLSKDMRSDLLEVHRQVIKLRQEVFDENRKQREIKKANSGN